MDIDSIRWSFILPTLCPLAHGRKANLTDGQERTYAEGMDDVKSQESRPGKCLCRLFEVIPHFHVTIHAVFFGLGCCVVTCATIISLDSGFCLGCPEVVYLPTVTIFDHMEAAVLLIAVLYVSYP